MAKNIKFESFKYRFLIAAQDISYQSDILNYPDWKDFLLGIEFNCENGNIVIAWQLPNPGCIKESLAEPSFYTRADNEKDCVLQYETSPLDTEDPVKVKNDFYFNKLVMRVAESAGYKKNGILQVGHDDRIQAEREFHDAWAESEDVEKIEVRASNEACTAPEMRCITRRLGNIKGKRLLDVGCGLGEASVYFALLGADVTASDLSQGMLNATTRLAQVNNVTVTQHIASAEDLQLPLDAKFDIIYAGNLLHHVDIEKTITRIKPHLASGGTFVTWDPLAYNPIINVYRSIATDVRTSDEHPLTWSDLQIFKRHFRSVETHYFWFSTLLIFIIMALIQRRNPNQERFWKVVVREEHKWRWLYQPLEKLDKFLLFLFPPLRLLCWNVVVISKC